MRQLKFRIWDGNNKYFVYPEILELDRGLEYQQFTGLFDKQGKEMFEGDIVTKRHRPDLHCLVYFDDRDFSYRLAIRGDKQFDKTLPLMFADEIIGCVYENPEFLKEGK